MTKKHQINYACKDRVHPNNSEPQWLQDGWIEVFNHEVQAHTLIPVMVTHRTEGWNPIPCGHTERVNDQRCRGCKWRLK